MAKCPACGTDFCYFPFHGPPECVKPHCKFYNTKHHGKMEEEMMEAERQKKKASVQLSFDYDTCELYQGVPQASDYDDADMLPSASDVFKAYASGQYKKP
jgi:hypothetical protein